MSRYLYEKRMEAVLEYADKQAAACGSGGKPKPKLSGGGQEVLPDKVVDKVVDKVPGKPKVKFKGGGMVGNVALTAGLLGAGALLGSSGEKKASVNEKPVQETWLEKKASIERLAEQLAGART